MTPLASAGAGSIVALAYLFIFLPVLVLVLFSFQGSTLPVPPFNGPSLRWYQDVLADGRLLDRPGQLAARRACSPRCWRRCWASSPPTALRAIRLPAARLLQGLLLAPLTVSYLIIGMGLLVTFNAVGVPRSLLAVGIGHVVINLPLCFAILYAQMSEPQARHRAGGAGPRCRRVAGAAAGDRAAAVAGSVRRVLPRLHPVLGRVHHRLPADPVRRHPAGRDLERPAHRAQPGDQRRGLAGVRRLDPPGAAGRAGPAAAARVPRERLPGAARGRAALRLPPLALAAIDLAMPAGAYVVLLGPSGQRQDHAAVDPGRLPSRRRCGTGADRRCRRHRPAAGAAADRDRVPGLRAVPAPLGRRQCRLRSRHARRRAPRPSAAHRVASAGPGRPRRLRPRGASTSSPAGSGSAWRWRARWWSSLRSCCSTSRWARSTSRCAARCRASSRRCSAASARPSSTSPTTRRRRWRWPICSWS